MIEQDTDAPVPQIYLFTYFKLEETTRWEAIFHPSLTNREEMPEMLKAERALYEIRRKQQHPKPGKEITAGWGGEAGAEGEDGMAEAPGCCRGCSST